MKGMQLLLVAVFALCIPNEPVLLIRSYTCKLILLCASRVICARSHACTNWCQPQVLFLFVLQEAGKDPASTASSNSRRAPEDYYEEPYKHEHFYDRRWDSQYCPPCKCEPQVRQGSLMPS
jgi:hypothetical protein